MLEQTIELVADCDLVLAGRIGPRALRQLEERGVAGLAAHLEINEALRRLNR
jgi:predicted Fe-Mo cluster-binding NifX family protein